MSHNPFRLSLLRLACVGTLMAGTAAVVLAEPAHGDAEARKFFDEVAKAYKSLSAYSDEGEFTQTLTIDGKTKTENHAMKLSLVRPNKLNLDAGLVRVTSDGKTMATLVVPTKQYTQGDAPKAVTFELFREAPLGSALFGGPQAPTSFILLNLLSGEDPVKEILELEEGIKLKLEADHKDKETGEVSRSLLVDKPSGIDFRLLVDPSTKLLRAIEWVVDPAELAAQLKDGPKLAIDRIAWTAGAVSTKSPAEDMFAFHAPTGFKKVESFKRAREAEEDYPVKELVGKPAPDFTLTVLDGDKKTKTLSKADLAGKVVLIDFWATWCGPCLMELPEVQKLVEGYAKAKKNVLIVALSQDSKPKEIEAVRELVEDTLKEKKITLTGNNVGLIGLDPSTSVGNAFAVQAIPTLVLLDEKGTVQAAYVGVQSRETLAKAIDTLLEGKSLIAPKADAAASK